jgi:hypothetical protein
MSSAARRWTDKIADGARSTADGACVSGAALRTMSVKKRCRYRMFDPHDASFDGDEIVSCLMAWRT